MKVLILAGGKGTRFAEESAFRPKPMIEVGEDPILVHIMKNYAHYGYTDFVILAGYKQKCIKEYFSNFYAYANDVTYHLSNNSLEVYDSPKYDWDVTVLDTGLNTNTGGRVAKAARHLNNEPFLITYGDAVGDINIQAVIDAHKAAGKKATICLYNFEQDKGVVELADDGAVKAFREKSALDGNLINIGYMVIEPEVIKMIHSEDTPLEQVLTELVEQGEVNAYVHKGFWQCMDTARQKEILEKLDASGQAPWKIWER